MKNATYLHTLLYTAHTVHIYTFVFSSISDIHSSLRVSCSKVKAACNIVRGYRLVQISILRVINTAMGEDHVHTYVSTV